MAIGRRGLWIGVVTIGVLLIGGSSWVSVRNLKPHPKEERHYKVERGDLVVDVVESGTVEAVKWVDVRPRTGGRVAQLLVEEGDRVQGGQVLAVIDPQETRLMVEGLEAQRRSAVSRLEQARISYETQEREAQAALKQAEARFSQATKEYEAQPSLTATSIEQAEANLENAKRELEILKTATLPQEILDADSRVQEAKATLDNTEAEYTRVQGLLEKGFSSEREVEAAKQQYDTARIRYDAAVKARKLLDTQHPQRLKSAADSVRSAQASYDQAKANEYLVKVSKDAYDSAKAGLAAAQAGLDGVLATKEQITQAQANIDQIGSQLADARRQLSETEIRSPMAGMVTQRYVQIGDLVTALSSFTAGDPVYQIADLSGLKIKLLVNEVDVTKLAVGQEVEITVDAVRGEVFGGTVAKIAPASEAATGVAAMTTSSSNAVVRFEVEVTVKQADPRLRHGMSARCRIITARAKNVLLLAAEAVGKEPKKGKEEYFAMRPTGKMVRGEKGKMEEEKERVPLEIGLKGVTKYQILKGAKEGDEFARAPYGGPKRKELSIFGPDHGEEEEEKTE
jgi:HlyD family secretion protein